MIEVADKKIKDIVESLPGSADEILRLGLDFCCGGDQTLEQQCRERGLEVEDVVKRILGNEDAPELKSWIPNEISDVQTLIQHIIVEYHRPHLEEFDFIGPLLDKVVEVHGASHGHLVEVQRLFRGIEQELREHMQKEEDILFPYILRLQENLKQGVPRNPRMSVKTLIDEIEDEHDDLGFVLGNLFNLTQGYVVPPDACQSYSLLYLKLKQLDRRIRRHAFIENEYLHPQAISVEAQFPQ